MREHKSSAKALTRSKSGANTTWKGLSEELEVGDYRVVNRGGLIANIDISVRWMEVRKNGEEELLIVM